jgi:hypothetical protein
VEILIIQKEKKDIEASQMLKIPFKKNRFVIARLNASVKMQIVKL